MKLPLKLRFRLRGDSSFITPNECGVMIMKEPPERAALFTPVAPDPNRFTVQVHADPASAHLGDKQLSAKDLADIIRGTPGYVPGTPVRMVACEAGQPIADGSPNLAQQLSRHLGVEVLAGDRTIWANRDGISTAQGSQLRLDRFGVPTPHLDQPGRWHVFQPDGTPPVTHNSPVPPGHVSEFQKARWHSDRNVRSGTWDPGDPHLPMELRHPGGGPGAQPVRMADGQGNDFQGHRGPYGQPVWHGHFDREGRWNPLARVDRQGRFVPGHLENGRLVDNGHYASNGAWVGKGRLDQFNRWIPVEFDGTRHCDTGRYDANGRWFQAGHLDQNGLWRPHGRFHPDTGHWIPNQSPPQAPTPPRGPQAGTPPPPGTGPPRAPGRIGPRSGDPNPVSGSHSPQQPVRPRPEIRADQITSSPPDQDAPGHEPQRSPEPPQERPHREPEHSSTPTFNVESPAAPQDGLPNEDRQTYRSRIESRTGEPFEESVARIRKEHPELANLDDEKAMSIRRYIGSDANTLNRILRDGDDVDRSYMSPEANVLRAALAEMPRLDTAETPQVYRDIAVREDEVSSVLSRYQPGTVVEEEAFTSASKATPPEYFGDKEERPVKIRFIIRDPHGARDLEATNPSEREVLWHDRNKFNVKQVEELDGVINIYMQDVGSE